MTPPKTPRDDNARVQIRTLCPNDTIRDGRGAASLINAISFHRNNSLIMPVPSNRGVARRSARSQCDEAPLRSDL